MKMIHTHLTQSPDASRPEDLEQINKIATDGLSIVVIGASGDLAKKKTYPALFELYLSEFLPKHTRIAGYARSELSDEDLRKKLRPFLLEKTPGATEVRATLDDVTSTNALSAGEPPPSPAVALHCTALHCTALHCTALH